jgi:hypothetical protein
MNSKPNYFIPVGSSLVWISFAGHLSWHKHSTNISYTFVIFIPGYPVNNIKIEIAHGWSDNVIPYQKFGYIHPEV